MTTCLCESDMIRLPRSMTSPDDQRDCCLCSVAEASLKQALTRIAQLPVNQRLNAVLAALGTYFDHKAITSTCDSAIPFAAGFRTFVASMGAMRSDLPISPETNQTLGVFIHGWIMALIEMNVAVNPPSVGIECGANGPVVSLLWRMNKRTFEAVIDGNDATYSATSFTTKGIPEYQEGQLATDFGSLLATLRWFIGHGG